MKISSHTPAANTMRTRRTESPREFVGELPLTGKGVGVAVFDSGIYPHPDVNANLAASVTVRKEGRQDNDWLGHGTAVAGVISGDGLASEGRLKGVAPDAKIINVQIFPPPADKEPPMHEIYAGVLNGIDWVIQNKEQYNIRVINISAGLLLVPSFDAQGQFQYFLDPLKESIQRAIDAGISVIAAAGNDGSKPGSIDRTPGVQANVITVGALDTNGTPQDPSDDKVAPFSSRGPSPDGQVKPDLLAPGVGILAPIVPHSQLAKKNEGREQLLRTLEKTDGAGVLTVVADKIRKQEVFSGTFKEAIPALREALCQAVRPEVAERLRQVQDGTVIGFTAKMLQKGTVTEEQLKEPLENFRNLAIEQIQPRPTKFFLIDGNPAYMSVDGTSFAAPIVSGVVAQMYEANPALTPADVQTILKSTASTLPGVDPNDGGAGVLNAQAAIAEALRRKAG